MRSVLPGVVGLLAAVALLAACEDTPPPKPLPAHEPVSPGDRYVAMGDSYTAAPFTGPLDSVANGCLQSTKNYPHLVEDELGVELVDVSCGGAQTNDLHEQSQRTTTRATVGPQIDALTEDTELVTVSVGANDEEIFADLISCATEDGKEDPEGAPCTEVDAEAGDDSFAARIDRMEERIVEVLEAITEEAPQARVVFVGYPQFAADESCREFPIAEGDTDLARRVNELLVIAQERAAVEADVEFLDLYELTEGHHFCADDPWVAGESAVEVFQQFHPYPREQQVAAEALAELVS